MTSLHYVEDCVVEERGGIVENTHKIHAAVVDATGQLLFTVGDASRLTLMRSAAKPAQALAILETGAFNRYGFDEADLALMCASHSGEPRHIDRARSMLAKSLSREEDLQCGGHAALSIAVGRAWIKADFEPTAICNNCSGKHAGMLAGAQALGEAKEGYHSPTHIMQLRVKQTFEQLLMPVTKQVLWACDGCNLPAPACSLEALAYMYAQFAAAADRTDHVNQRTRHMARIFNAMVNYPEMVGGEGRYCTILMEAFDRNLIGKVGADGCYGIGIRESESTRSLGAKGSVGIAVKVEDGSIEILYSVVSEILSRLSIGDTEKLSHLAKFHQIKRLNTAAVVSGYTYYPFQIRRCSL